MCFDMRALSPLWPGSLACAVLLHHVRLQRNRQRNSSFSPSEMQWEWGKGCDSSPMSCSTRVDFRQGFFCVSFKRINTSVFCLLREDLPPAGCAEMITAGCQTLNEAAWHTATFVVLKGKSKQELWPCSETYLAEGVVSTILGFQDH